MMYDKLFQPREPWMWKSGHPFHLAPMNDGWWWDFEIFWARLAGAYAEEQRRIERWLWFWAALSGHFQSVVSAQKSLDESRFVRLPNGQYGRVVPDWRKSRKERVAVLRDRHYNWVRKISYVEVGQDELTTVIPWPMDQRYPWDIFGIPRQVKEARRQEALGKRSERARKQSLRRWWRGLDKWPGDA